MGVTRILLVGSKISLVTTRSNIEKEGEPAKNLGHLHSAIYLQGQPKETSHRKKHHFSGYKRGDIVRFCGLQMCQCESDRMSCQNRKMPDSLVRGLGYKILFWKVRTSGGCEHWCLPPPKCGLFHHAKFCMEPVGLVLKDLRNGGIAENPRQARHLCRGTLQAEQLWFTCRRPQYLQCPLSKWFDHCQVGWVWHLRLVLYWQGRTF